MAYTERYVRADANGAGDGTTDTNSGANGAYTWAQMVADTTAGPIRYNIKNGSYSRTTTVDNAFTAGTTAAPRVLRGFNNTIGDLDNIERPLGQAMDTTNFPVITYTTGRVVFPAYGIIENLVITSASTSATVTQGTHGIIRRCKISNTHASSATSIGLTLSSGGNSITEDSDISISSSSSSAKAISAIDGKIARCLMTGNTAGAGCIIIGAGRVYLQDCMLRDAGFGIDTATGSLQVHIESCSFRNITNNYLNNQSTANGMWIINCVAWGVGGSSKWYNSSTSIRANFQSNNAIGNMGVGDTNEGDWYTINETALTIEPFISSTDLRLNGVLNGGLSCKTTGIFRNKDLGAIQAQNPQVSSAWMG